MLCSESLRVQAYFDGELDASTAVDVERHLEHCGECRGQLEELQRVCTLLSRVPRERAPEALRARVLDALDAATSSPLRRGRRIGGLTEAVRAGWRSRAFWAGTLAGVGGSAVAASVFVGLGLLSRPVVDPVLDELVGAHVRSLMPSHLFDVASESQHTVKPWFAGHADVSPVVADFKEQGYGLVGGRVDYVDHRRSAVTVYQHGAHIINVFSWPVGNGHAPAEGTAVQDGYRMIFWRIEDLEYCAVSDTGWSELWGLADLLQNLARSEVR